MLIVIFALVTSLSVRGMVVEVTLAKHVDWSRHYVDGKFYVCGAYYCTKTGNLAAAVAHNGKTLSPHYARTDKPALIIYSNNTAQIVRLVALDAKHVHLKDGRKIPVAATRLVLEGDDNVKGANPFAFVATDGHRIAAGAAYGVSWKVVTETLRRAGFTQVMQLDSGHATYAKHYYSRCLNNFLVFRQLQ